MSHSEDAPKRDTRIPFMASPAEIAEIDNYRYGERIPSRSEALRRLLRLGLQAHAWDRPWQYTRKELDTILGETP